jgi:hypothetical protein
MICEEKRGLAIKGLISACAKSLKENFAKVKLLIIFFNNFFKFKN